MFKDEFLDSLPTDPEQALLAMCERFIGFDESNSSLGNNDIEYYEEYLEAYAAFEAFLDAYPTAFTIPGLGDDEDKNIALIGSFVHGIRKTIKKMLAITNSQQHALDSEQDLVVDLFTNSRMVT